MSKVARRHHRAARGADNRERSLKKAGTPAPHYLPDPVSPHARVRVHSYTGVREVIADRIGNAGAGA